MRYLYKIIIIAFLSLSIIFHPQPVSAEENVLYGDINNDKDITLRDALLVLKHIAFNDNKLDDSQIKYADVNFDGSVTAEDAYQIFLCAIDQSIGFNYENISTNGTVWIASDSIAAGVGGGLYGWGQVIGDYLLDGVAVHNTAISGSTSKSFTWSDNYQTIMDNMKAGDILFICFGHNDTKGGSTYTSPYADSSNENAYKYYLKKYYIDPAYRKGVQPILMSSPARCYGILENPTTQYHYYYTKAAKELAEEYAENGIDLPFIDMFPMTIAEYQYLGKEAAYNRYHNSRDQIHYNETGARFAAQLILTTIKNENWDFAKYIDTSKLTDPRSYPH